MKLPGIFNNKILCYALLFLAAMNVVGYLSTKAYECLVVFGLAYYFGHCYLKNQSAAILVGLFASNFVFGCGRCDLHGGNPEEMFNSLKNLKETLDKDTIILPGHDYSVKRESTIKEQITGNPFMHFEDLSKFVEYRMSIHDKTRPSPYDMVYKT